MAKYFDPYILTEEQKQFIRDNSTVITIESIVDKLRVPRSKVMQVILAEKLSINIVKTKPKPLDRRVNMHSYFRKGN